MICEDSSTTKEETVENKEECLANLLPETNIIIIMYLYSAQYLHILQDSKRYLTAQVQPQLTSN